MHITKKSRITIIAPHPDDEWIGCGCTILKCSDIGADLQVILVTGRVRERVKLSKNYAQKFGYKLHTLKMDERHIDTVALKEALQNMVRKDDIVYIPASDSHPDHRLIHETALATLRNRVIEFAIYNNSRNIVKRLGNKVRSLITKKGYPSFSRGRGEDFSYKQAEKEECIKEMMEFPRAADHLRELQQSRSIAFLTKDYHIDTVDAGFTSVVALAKELKRRGHDPVIIQNKGYASWYEPPARKAYEVHQGIPIYRPYGFRWFNIRWMHINPAMLFNRFLAPGLGVKSVQRQRGKKFDIIHGSSSAPYLVIPSLIGRLFARDAKVFHTIRSTTTYGIWWLKVSRLLNLTDGVFVPLESIRNRLIADGCRPERIHKIPSAIDLKQIHNTWEGRSATRKKYGISPNEKLILYYGKMGYNKGVDVLIRSIGYLKNPHARFLLFHPVVWLPWIRELAEQNPNSEKLSLIVEKIHVPDILAAADLLVLPYRSLDSTEGNPLCLLEALAAKVPVLTTDLDDIREIVHPGRHVLVTQPDDEADLADKIRYALSHPRELEQMSIRAFEHVQSFDIRSIAKRHCDLYE